MGTISSSQVTLCINCIDRYISATIYSISRTKRSINTNIRWVTSKIKFLDTTCSLTIYT